MTDLTKPIILPYALLCPGCGGMLLWEKPPTPPDYWARYICKSCDRSWHCTLPRIHAAEDTPAVIAT